MFCRNCANQMDDKAAVCVRCGVPAGVGTSFCPNCGSATAPQAALCVNCGVYFSAPPPASDAKSKTAAGILGILLGGFGVHNFYLGFTSKAVAQLLITVLSCGILSPVSAIWGLVEGIMILTADTYLDAAGNPLKN